MVVTLGQQCNTGEKPTVMLYTYINRHAGTPDKNKTKTFLEHRKYIYIGSILINRSFYSRGGLPVLNRLDIIVGTVETKDSAKIAAGTALKIPCQRILLRLRRVHRDTDHPSKSH